MICLVTDTFISECPTKGQRLTGENMDVLDWRRESKDATVGLLDREGVAVGKIKSEEEIAGSRYAEEETVGQHLTLPIPPKPVLLQYREQRQCKPRI